MKTRNERIDKNAWRLLLGCTLVACGKPEIVHRLARADATPERLSVAAAKVTLGHENGTLREDVQVAAFEIARYPVTVADYRKCVTAGVCSAPAPSVEGPNVSENTYSDDSAADRLPLVGIAAAQAGRYCEWVGGRLPNYAEWQLAARGPDVRRYAWGNATPTCSQHMVEYANGEYRCCVGNCAQPKVGERPTGAAPSGIEDVLLLPGGELVGSGSRQGPLSCSRSAGACVATSISGVLPAIERLNPADDSTSFAFRCAWGKDT